MSKFSYSWEKEPLLKMLDGTKDLLSASTVDWDAVDEKLQDMGVDEEHSGMFYSFVLANEPEAMSNIPNIYRRMFMNCAELVDVDLTSFKDIYSIDAYAFNFCLNMRRIALPSHSFEVGDSAFEDCMKLEEIDLGGATKVGSSCFEGCDKLEKINLKEVKIIRRGAFKDCSSLREVDMSNVVIIQVGAFEGCAALESIVIPDSCNLVGDLAFEGCDNLKTISAPSSLARFTERLEAGNDAKIIWR